MGTTRAIARPVIEDAVAVAKPVRTHERQALFDAIRARDAQLHAVKEAEQAAARVDTLVRDAEAKLAQASASAKAAREQHSERIAAAAKSNTPLPSGASSRAAIQHELEASDHLEATKKAAQISEQDLVAAQQRLKDAEAGIAQAADGVIRAVDGTALVDEMEAVQHRLVALRLAHRYFRKNGLYPDKETEKRGERLCTWEFASASGAAEFQSFDSHPRFRDWQIARESLLRDADAPLPGEPGHRPLPLHPDSGIARAKDAAATDDAIRSLLLTRAQAAAAE